MGELEKTLGAALRPQKARHAPGAEHRTPVPLGNLRADAGHAQIPQTVKAGIRAHIHRQPIHGRSDTHRHRAACGVSVSRNP